MRTSARAAVFFPSVTATPRAETSADERRPASQRPLRPSPRCTHVALRAAPPTVPPALHASGARTSRLARLAYDPHRRVLFSGCDDGAFFVRKLERHRPSGALAIALLKIGDPAATHSKLARDRSDAVAPTVRVFFYVPLHFTRILLTV